MRCPQGKYSAGWKEPSLDSRDQHIAVHFKTPTCRPCPARSLCTRAKQFRRKLRFWPRAQHEALQTARTQHASAAGHRLYTKRAGIEGTLSQGVRAFELRRTRYLGQAKTRLQPIATAVAMNIDRLMNWLDETLQAQTRLSRFKPWPSDTFANSIRSFKRTGASPALSPPKLMGSLKNWADESLSGNAPRRGGVGSRGPQPDPPRLDDSQTAWQAGKHDRLLEEEVYQVENKSHGGMPGEREDHNARIQGWRIVADIRKIKVAGEQTEALGLSIGSNGRVWRVSQTDISHIEGGMAGPPQVGVDKKRTVRI